MDYVYLYGIIEKEHERRTTPSSIIQAITTDSCPENIATV